MPADQMDQHTGNILRDLTLLNFVQSSFSHLKSPKRKTKLKATKFPSLPMFSAHQRCLESVSGLPRDFTESVSTNSSGSQFLLMLQRVSDNIRRHAFHIAVTLFVSALKHQIQQVRGKTGKTVGQNRRAKNTVVFYLVVLFFFLD